jgi:threonine/homoserine/homoserine lactone efflux protein
MEQSIGSVLVDLLPLMIGAAVVPIPVIIVLLLLGNRGGLARGAAFVGGAIIVRLAQGIVFGYVFASDPTATTDAGGNLIVSVLLLVIGILMLITAYKKWDKEEDPDAPPPRWMAALGGLSALQAFGMGAALVALAVKQWVFTLAAIGVLSKAHLGPQASIMLFVCYVLAAQAFGLVAVIAHAVAPRRAGDALARVNAWLERNNRTILIAASLTFGVFFLYKGISGLTG